MDVVLTSTSSLAAVGVYAIPSPTESPATTTMDAMIIEISIDLFILNHKYSIGTKLLKESQKMVAERSQLGSKRKCGLYYQNYSSK